MRRFQWYFCVCCLVVFLSAIGGCRDKSEDADGFQEKTPEGLTKVTLQLNYFPEAEHGGFYTAQLEGYFAEEGIEVEIIPGGPVAEGCRLAGLLSVDRIIHGCRTVPRRARTVGSDGSFQCRCMA